MSEERERSTVSKTKKKVCSLFEVRFSIELSRQLRRGGSSNSFETNLSRSFSLFFTLVMLILVLQSCDGLYGLKVIADLPTDQAYQLSFQRHGQDDAWILSEKDFQLLATKEYRGFSLIYENQKVGPGINQLDILQIFWNAVEALSFTGKVDGAIHRITRSDVSVYKESKNNIIILIKIR